jgi:CMP-N-acetylneuraminic acid synthetase
VSRTIPAFLPLKGHSERVPGKNLRDFAGRPLFQVIVETLQAAQRVGPIYIDTDDAAIARSARDLEDVVVIDRRPDLVGDAVSVNRLIRAFLDTHDDADLLQTHATNPLLRAATIDGAIDAYLDDPSITSLFAVTRFQARFYDPEGTAINHDPSELIPTQDLDPIYMENSNFYVFSRDGFLQHDHRVTPATRMFEVDPLEAIDIDEEADFALALAVARAGILADRGPKRRSPL